MKDPIAFVEKHGVVLESARGPLPNVAEWIVGEPIRMRWWAHPKGREIFGALAVLANSPDVLSFKLVNGKVTFVHRRLWPALVRLVDHFGTKLLTLYRQEHTRPGAHRNRTVPFPKWVDAATKDAASELTEAEAHSQLGEWSRVSCGCGGGV